MDIDDPKFYDARLYFRMACSFSRLHAMLVDDALRAFGEHGPYVSGVGRDHFPAHVKEQLRYLAERVGFYSKLAYDSRPPRVRKATMRYLARVVATEDGSGYYGPQAL